MCTRHFAWYIYSPSTVKQWFTTHCRNWALCYWNSHFLFLIVISPCTTKVSGTALQFSSTAVQFSGTTGNVAAPLVEVTALMCLSFFLSLFLCSFFFFVTLLLTSCAWNFAMCAILQHFGQHCLSFSFVRCEISTLVVFLFSVYLVYFLLRTFLGHCAVNVVDG